MHEADAARLAELLGDVRRLFKEKVTTWADSPGVPLTRVVVLREVARDPGVGVSTLGRRTGFSKGYVSSTVEQMEEEGLLDKTAHPKDQRCLQIRLTRSGISCSSSAQKAPYCPSRRSSNSLPDRVRRICRQR